MMKSNESSSPSPPPSDSQTPSELNHQNLAANQADHSGQTGLASKFKGFNPKSAWPIALLVLLAACGNIGFRVFQSLRSDAGVSEAAIATSRLQVKTVRAQTSWLSSGALMKAW